MTKYVINPKYLSDDVLKTAAKYFARENSIQLRQFLLPEAFAKAARALSNASLGELYVPDQYRWHAPKKIPESVSVLLSWLKSEEASKIISCVANRSIRCALVGISVLTQGDYSLLHDKLKEPPGYDVILDFTPRWDNRACGHHSYVDGNGNELARVPVMPNALAIVKRPAGVMKFVKYVNHYAGKDRRIVLEARYA